MTNTLGKIIYSPICSLAHSLDEQMVFHPDYRRVDELIFAYLNQYRFIIDSFEELQKLFIELNSASFIPDENTTLTEFDIRSLSIEPKFRHYSHLLITSLKSLVDLFICLLDICQNRVFRSENDLPDFFKYGKEKVKPILNHVPEIIEELDRLRTDKENWINRVSHLRNRIIHRGYLLKPEIAFKKLETFILQSYKGNNYYIGIDRVDIGQLFNEFQSHMPQIEQIFTDHLINSNLAYTMTHELSLRYDDLINIYDFKEIKMLEG